ncbi:GTP cyclohydrolase FolE2 [Luteibacter sp. 9135]|uniref:GTP cyclohydrolase FolE2 n=1 Tax=Luteibacter sp. 9135 TaxID=1500893 RepID=UPI00055DD7AE|nr:GTP cyclohydrolase FolE2 [Luteibacter sp. 9135]
MYIHESPTRLLPDVASQDHALALGTLEWVGMDGMEMPVAFDAGDGDVRSTGARVGAFVNLVKAEARGIHMSRLYLLVSEALGARPLTIAGVRTLLEAFLASHEGLSDHARITIGFEHLVRRPALRSENSGWRAYPITVEATLSQGAFRLEITTDVVYSSTCPASAALSRQLIQDNFASAFSSGQPLDRDTVLAWLGTEKGVLATPHAQRSTATLRLCPVGEGVFPLIGLIDQVENALGTPVQTAVKRADEQAFALANGQNLMFCEDAARRIQKTLEAAPDVADYHIRVAHHESLHPHDAVAFARKAR